MLALVLFCLNDMNMPKCQALLEVVYIMHIIVCVCIGGGLEEMVCIMLDCVQLSGLT